MSAFMCRWRAGTCLRDSVREGCDVRGPGSVVAGGIEPGLVEREERYNQVTRGTSTKESSAL